jgi:hypothetical protein
MLQSDGGRQAYNEMLLALANRASLVAAAARIGVHPNTVSNWIARGKREPDSVYGEFYRGVVHAIGQATAESEIQVNQQDPKFYLTRGTAKVLIGDAYNHINPNANTDYGLDGSITVGVANDQSVEREPTQIAIESDDNSTDDQIENTLLLQALTAMRQSGIDLNELADRAIANNSTLTIE